MKKGLKLEKTRQRSKTKEKLEIDNNGYDWLARESISFRLSEAQPAAGAPDRAPIASGDASKHHALRRDLDRAISVQTGFSGISPKVCAHVCFACRKNTRKKKLRHISRHFNYFFLSYVPDASERVAERPTDTFVERPSRGLSFETKEVIPD
ncbi:unnamed protein product [Caenorhabditis auriculariae]|uniref:Uncharacterized protein n=1 Tax=Caenorhabditis auriculariae TaxID=2777116 RepID=A0A8S1HBP0_9PELO|nr:unnamed protein product [Caenorhabditis auriculariae]